MSYLKLFKTSYIANLKNITANETNKYLANHFEYDESQVLTNKLIQTDYPTLLSPEGRNLYNFDNSKIVFEGYKLSPMEASNPRVWTFLTHVTYWDYMRIREPLEKIDKEKRPDYIKTHWFIDGVNPANLLRNNISLLWWTAYLTYDSSKKDPYELTKEAFTMLDYNRHLLSGTQGRNKNFTHALLEFVLENEEIFSKYKAEKVRFLMRRSNYVGGYKLLSVLSKNDIKTMFEKYIPDILSITE